jgi:hypothetical protein
MTTFPMLELSTSFDPIHFSSTLKASQNLGHSLETDLIMGYRVTWFLHLN